MKISTKKQVFTFFIGTYLISWTLFFVGYKTNLLPIILLGIWGPSITSVILTLIYYKKEGLMRMLSRFRRYKIKWYLWLLLLFLPITIHFTGRSLWQLFYDGGLNPIYLDSAYWLGALIPSFIIAGFGEELGWRGFALPRLQLNYSPIKASIILALIHLFWHLPTYWLGQGIHNVPFVFVLAFVFPWTFIFNWLYNKSGGSLIFAISFHAISNASLSIVRFMPLDSEVPINTDLITKIFISTELAGPYLSVCAIYTVIALIIIRYGNFKVVNTDIP